MVIRVSNSKLLTEVPETVVKPTIGHADIVRTHSNFVQHVGTEVMGPIDHAIFQARQIEAVEEEPKGVNPGDVLSALRNPTVQLVSLRDFVINPHIPLVHIVVTSTGVDEVVHHITVQG